MLSTPGLKCVVLVSGLCLLGLFSSQAPAAGSLTDLDIEYGELQVTLEKFFEENRQLRDALTETEQTLAEMRKNLAAASGETEVFKRQSMELKLRMEALGLETAGGNSAKLEQRLLTAVSDLRVMTDEKSRLTEALVRLADAAGLYAKSATGAPPESRMALETELRHANRVLGNPSANAQNAMPVAPTLTDGMAISVRDDLSLVIINIGKVHGVRVGMPFRVLREQNVIAKVQVIDVREKISGAIIQYLSSEKERIRVGDHLKVDAQQ